MKALIAIFLILPLLGCATLNESECLGADWQKIGVEDGNKGLQESYLHNHQEACSQHGVIVGKSNYLKGRSEGIKNYCTAKNAYNEGIRGNKYRGVCSETNTDEFLSAYLEGLTIRLHTIDLQYNRLDLALLSNRYKRRRSHYKNDRSSSSYIRQGRLINKSYALRNRHHRSISEQLKIRNWISVWSQHNS